MYVYICMYVYVYICIYMYIYVCVFVYMYLCMYVSVPVCVFTYVRVYVCGSFILGVQFCQTGSGGHTQPKTRMYNVYELLY